MPSLGAAAEPPPALDLLLQIDPSVRERALDDELVLYHPGTDTVTRLNYVSASAWHELRQPRSTNQLLARLAETFTIDVDEITNDVRQLVKDLVAAQLVCPADSAEIDSPEIDSA